MSDVNAGEVEVLLRRWDDYAKVLWVKIEGDNVYAGTLPTGSVPQLKVSRHGPSARLATTRAHTRVVGETHEGRRVQWDLPETVHEGIAAPWAIGPLTQLHIPAIPWTPLSEVEWGYDATPLEQRRTVMIDVSDLAGKAAGVDAWSWSNEWAKGNRFSPDDFVTDYASRTSVLDSAVLDWTHPRVLVVAYAIKAPPGMPPDSIGGLLRTPPGSPPPDHAFQVSRNRPPVKHPIDSQQKRSK